MDELAYRMMQLLPKRSLSRVVGAATRLGAPETLHQAAIRAFCRHYGVADEEAELPISEYKTFAAFFTRRLRPSLRPIAAGETVVVSPVDGAVSSCGQAVEGRLIQAKGRDYSLAKLLGDEAEGRRFTGGRYVTLYLSPRDYHRIHAPLGGSILGFSYVPGQLFPVNRPSVRRTPGLFAVNERLITYLDTKLGRVAVVAVGATMVGRIRSTYDDTLTNAGHPPRRVQYEHPKPIAKGDELAVFEMGSTVILVFEPGRVRLDDFLVPEAPVRMGQRIGEAEAQEAKA